MKKTESCVSRRGFSLIEMMVVVGIIAILTAALLPFLGGSTDSADCAKCKNNMKNLAMAVISCAQASDVGHFTAAGYYRTLDVDNDGKYYYPHVSWILNKGDFSDLKKSLRTMVVGTPAHFTDSEDVCREVIKHGSIWTATGAAFESYRCPVHEREFEKKCEKKNRRPPGWSFMMNQEFGYAEDQSKPRAFCGSSIHDPITVATDASGKNRKGKRGHDKVLMFAEIQGLDVDDKKHGVSLKAVSGSGKETDAVLEYAKENMGFNHKLGKYKWGGNVAFADGHVDTITMPKDKSYIKNLTRYLCQGIDVPHDGSRYTPTDADK